MLIKLTIADGRGEANLTGIFEAESIEKAINENKPPIEWEEVPQEALEASFPGPTAKLMFRASNDDHWDYDGNTFLYAEPVELNVFQQTD